MTMITLISQVRRCRVLPAASPHQMLTFLCMYGLQTTAMQTSWTIQTKLLVLLAPPPTTEPQQPNNHHGTDDVDEFGPAPSRGMMTNVVVAVPQTEATVIVDLTSSTQKEPSGKEIDCTPNIDNLLDDLEQQAKALGVGHSEWYEIRQRPLLEILALIETLRTPLFEGAASSSAPMSSEPLPSEA